MQVVIINKTNYFKEKWPEFFFMKQQPFIEDEWKNTRGIKNKNKNKLTN